MSQCHQSETEKAGVSSMKKRILQWPAPLIVVVVRVAVMLPGAVFDIPSSNSHTSTSHHNREQILGVGPPVPSNAEMWKLESAINFTVE